MSYQAVDIRAMIRPICNKNPSSAPIVCGKPFFLCWRCTGAIISAIVTIIFCFYHRNICSTKVLLLSSFLAIPGAIDKVLGDNSIIKPSTIRRFVTGLLLGIPVGMLACAMVL